MLGQDLIVHRHRQTGRGAGQAGWALLFGLLRSPATEQSQSTLCPARAYPRPFTCQGGKCSATAAHVHVSFSICLRLV